MRVLLAQPPLLPAGEVAPPVGLCTLASWVLHLGHACRILDLDLEGKSAPQNGKLDYKSRFAKEAREYAPDIVAVTSMYSNSLQAEELLRTARQVLPRCTTIAGGPHFGALGRRAIERIHELDCAIQGEGELAFARLLAALEAGAPLDTVPNLCWRAPSGVTMNAPAPLIELAELPPMWSGLKEVLSLERYYATIPRGARRRMVYIEAGRGCPYACSFCATAPFWQRKYRVKPVERIVEEIRFLHEQIGYDTFLLIHDLLTINSSFMAELSDALVAARLPIEWMANSRTDVRLRGVLPKMKAAGCWKLFLGVESASARVQRSIMKNLPTAEIVDAVTELRDHGIGATCSFVIGFPSEAARDLSATIRMAARLTVSGVETVQIHRLRLFPPAPLTRAVSATTFDSESLRIEYPFLEAAEEDIAAIRSDPEFFSGYFSPTTCAGTPEQLAQVEMFFQQALQLAPLTVSVLASICGDELASEFFALLERRGGVRRDELDWDTGDVRRNWSAIRPLLRDWVNETRGECSRALASGALAYEAIRHDFLQGTLSNENAPLICGDAPRWIAFRTTIDLDACFSAAAVGGAVDEALLRSGAVVLARRNNGTAVGYAIEDSHIERLIRGDRELVEAMCS